MKQHYKEGRRTEADVLPGSGQGTGSGSSKVGNSKVKELKLFQR